MAVTNTHGDARRSSRASKKEHYANLLGTKAKKEKQVTIIDACNQDEETESTTLDDSSKMTDESGKNALEAYAQNVRACLGRTSVTSQAPSLDNSSGRRHSSARARSQSRGRRGSEPRARSPSPDDSDEEEEEETPRTPRRVSHRRSTTTSERRARTANNPASPPQHRRASTGAAAPPRSKRSSRVSPRFPQNHPRSAPTPNSRPGRSKLSASMTAGSLPAPPLHHSSDTAEPKREETTTATTTRRRVNARAAAAERRSQRAH